VSPKDHAFACACGKDREGKWNRQGSGANIPLIYPYHIGCGRAIEERWQTINTKKT